MTTDVSEEVGTLPETQDTPLPTAGDTLETQPTGEAESPVAQADSEPSAQAPAPRTPFEIQAAVDAGEVLTTAEKTSLREYERAENNRAYAVQQARQQQEQRNQYLRELQTQFPAKLSAKINELIDNGEAHPRLMEVEVREMAQQLLSEAEPLTLLPYTAAIELDVYNTVSEAGGNGMGTVQWMRDNAKDFPSMWRAYGAVMKQLGARAGTDGAKLTNLEAENVNLKAQVEELSKVKGTVTTQGKSGADNGVSSLAEAEQMHAGVHPSGKIFTTSEMRAWRVSHGYSPL